MGVLARPILWWLLGVQQVPASAEAAKTCVSERIWVCEPSHSALEIIRGIYRPLSLGHWDPVDKTAPSKIIMTRVAGV